MHLEHTHQFPVPEAVSRLQALTDYWQKKYGISTQWNGSAAQFSGTVKGFNFSGALTVQETRVVADVKVGFLAEKLGGRSYVETKLADYFNPSNSLDQLQARAK